MLRNGLPVLGRDTYADGRGRMLIRLLDLITVGDGTGEAFDIGELVTYLNDGIMMAPSMLLVPEVRWSEVDAGSFDVALTDHGRTVKGARVRRPTRRAGQLRDDRPLLFGPQGCVQSHPLPLDHARRRRSRHWGAAAAHPRHGGVASTRRRTRLRRLHLGPGDGGLQRLTRAVNSANGPYSRASSAGRTTPDGPRSTMSMESESGVGSTLISMIEGVSRCLLECHRRIPGALLTVNQLAIDVP